MKLARHLVAVSALSFVGLSATSGCADNETQIFIRQVQAVIPPQCVANSDPSGVFRSSGTLDVALNTVYNAWILVGNQLVQRGDSTILRVESGRVEFEGVIVRLEDQSGAVIQEFTVPSNGFADPSTGQAPSYGLINADIVPSVVGASLGQVVTAGSAQRIIAVLKVFGRSLGGREIESQEFLYPIDVCSGCLIEREVAQGAGGICEQPTGQVTEVELPCTVGNDVPIGCVACQILFTNPPASCLP